MSYYIVSYYRTRNWIDKKYVKSELGCTDAIRKTKLKDILEVTEITKEEYEAYKTQQKQEKQQRKLLEQSMFVQ